MTRAEKDAVARLQFYLLLSDNDLERALFLVERFCPRDRKRIDWLRETARPAR